MVHERTHPPISWYTRSRWDDLMQFNLNQPKIAHPFSAVFVLNYSWAHNGLWNLAKYVSGLYRFVSPIVQHIPRRALPSTALAKVFFPTQTELLEYFTPSVIPRGWLLPLYPRNGNSLTVYTYVDYGGQLPFLSQLDDPLHSFVRSASAAAQRTLTIQRSPPPHIPAMSSHSEPAGRPINRNITPTSTLNPFFGYPVYYTASSSVPALQHGRRRKRDLIRTLGRLWWIRWRKHVTRGIYVLLGMMVILLARKVPWQEWRWQWKAFILRALTVALASTSVAFARTPIGLHPT